MSGCLVAMYHYVRDTAATPFPAINALGLGHFDAQLDALAERRRPLAYAEFAARCGDRRALDRDAFLLTFDDGFVDHYEAVLPRLRARGLQGIFFIAGATLADPPRVLNVHKTHFLIARLGADAFRAAVLAAVAALPAAVERTAAVYRYDHGGDRDVKHLLNYELPHEAVDEVLTALFEEHIGDERAFARTLYLTRDQIREMAAAGMIFGYHTHRHPVLARLARSAQQRELADGVALVRALTGQSSVPFCYPFGHPHTYSGETRSLLRELGYACAFSTDRRIARPDADDAFAVPRYDTRDLPPFAEALPHA